MMTSDSLNGDMMTDVHKGEHRDGTEWDRAETDGAERGGTDHRWTYDRFMATTKWAVIGISGALILMALLLV